MRSTAVPQIGDIKKGFEIGYQGSESRIWQACSCCGKERWVTFRVKEGVPVSLKCLSCANSKTVPKRKYHKTQAELEPEEHIALTGKCKTCGASMDTHPTCAACGNLCGTGHEAALCDYRGHKVCGHCITAWKRLDRIINRKAKWGEFLKPDLLKYKEGSEEMEEALV